MSTTDEEGLLGQCPCCEYSLRGLPEQHHCPECGLLFDRRWRVLAGRTVAAKQSSFHRTMLVGSLAILSMLVWTFVVEFRSSGWTLWNCVSLGAVFIVAIFIWGMRSSAPQTFLAIGPDGVIIYRGKNTFERYSWSQISHAEYNILRQGIEVFVDGRKILLSDARFFRGDMLAAAPSAAAINAYPRPEPAEDTQVEAGSE